MKYTWRIGEIPDGDTPLDRQSVVVRNTATGATITTITTDDDGYVTLQTDGHYPPFYLHLQGVPGGDKYWDSTESHAVGAYSPKELPVALRVAGDGVIRGYAGELAVALFGGGPSVTIADGAANVAGHPFVQYTDVTGISITRPVTSTRIDRVIIRLYPEGSATTPGKADLAILAGVEGSAATALTQSATVYEVALATLTIPTAGAVTLTDDRVYSAGETPPVAGETRSAGEATTNASGEVLTNLNTSLVLPRTATYDVEAWVSAIQDNGGGWVLQGTFGSFGAGTSPNFNGPKQVAVNSAGKSYIADNGNSRLVRLNSDGTYDTSITGLTNIFGVCVDSSDNVYVSYNTSRLATYDSSLVLVTSRNLAPVPAVFRHAATDGTNLYVADTGRSVVGVYSCSTLATVTNWGSAGSGDGQFNSPIGIATDGTHVYVGDGGNFRVQKFTTAGVYVTKWGSFGTDPGQFSTMQGLVCDDSGDVWVADYGNQRLDRFSNTGTYQDTITQATPSGVGRATGDVLWVGNPASNNIAKWDEAAAGYGGLAVEIDSNLGTYITLGDLDAMIQNSHTRTATGPATISVKAYAKATSGTATFRSIVLSAKAVPRS